MTKTDKFISDWQISYKTEQIYQNPNAPDWKDADHYKVTMFMRHGGKKRQYTTYYSMGYALKRKPTLAEVLQCLAMDIRSVQNENLTDWCASMGYSDDSIRANRIYSIINKQADDIENWLSFSNAWKQFLKLDEEDDE